MDTTKARHWCFTLNSWTEEELELLERFDGSYLIYGFEVGDNGNPHLQGYCEFIGPTTLKHVRTCLGGRAHLEIRRGTQSQAIAYCKKDGNWWERGTKALGQGHRSDLDGVVHMIKEGKPLSLIAAECTAQMILYSKGIEKTKLLVNKPKPWRDVEVIVYWGETGSGKTRKAMEESPYKLNQNTNGTLWFDGYDGEKTLLLDDFYGWIKYGELLTLLDGYPYRCQTKGGHCWAEWTKVIITSNKFWADWYKAENQSALKRRISQSIKF